MQPTEDNVLTHFVIFYVPSTFNVGQVLSDIAQQEITRRIAKAFSIAFGGATAIPSTGYYTANNGDLIEEHITLVKSYYENGIDGEKIACQLAETIKTEYGQESIAIETKNGMQFV